MTGRGSRRRFPQRTCRLPSMPSRFPVVLPSESRGLLAGGLGATILRWLARDAGEGVWEEEHRCEAYIFNLCSLVLHMLRTSFKSTCRGM